MATQLQTKKKQGIILYSPTYYAACTLGGIIACGPTHTCKSVQPLQKELKLTGPVQPSHLLIW